MASPFVRHLPILATCAVVLTVLFQWNLLSAIVRTGYASQPGIVIESDDEPYYLALIKETARHPGEEGSPFIQEGRRDQWTYPMGMVRAAGGLMRTMHWDLKTTAMVLDFVCPFLISFLVLCLFLCWFEGRLVGYVAGVAYLTLPSLFGFWQRPVSPQLTFFPLLLVLVVYASWQWKSYWRDILLGLGGGIVFYTYPFHWTFILPLFVLDDAWTIWREKQFNKKQLIKYLVLGAVASAAIVSMAHVNHQALYAETMQRLGLLHDHSPTGIPLQAKLVLLLVVFLFFEMRMQRTSWRALQLPPAERQMVVGMVAGFLVLNQAMVTGAQLEFNAHYQPLILIFAVALLAKMLERLAERLVSVRRKALYFLLAGVVVVLCASGFSRHLRQNPFAWQDPMNTSEAHEVYAWIRAETPKASVVSVPSELFHGIPLFTDAYLQFSDLQWFLIGPTADLLERFVYADPKNTALTEEAASSQRMLLGFTYLAPLGKREPRVRFLKRLHIPVEETASSVPSEIVRVRTEREALTAEDWQTGLVRYGVGHVVLRKDHLWPPIPPGQTVFENQTYLIQKL